VERGNSSGEIRSEAQEERVSEAAAGAAENFAESDTDARFIDFRLR